MLVPPSTPTLNLAPPSLPSGLAPGGARYQVKSVIFKGNSVFSDKALTAALGNFADVHYDLAGMGGLANLITMHYRRSGYPFARAFIPEQTLTDNQLLIEIIESRYGAVSVAGSDPQLVGVAQSYLEQLRSGDLIESSKLERALLILSDMPGIRVESIVRPGELRGTGDLIASVTQQRRWSMNVEADNLGSRYSGVHRASAELYMTHLLMYGDRLVLRSLYSTEDLWFGGVNYEAPLGSGGWRAYLGLDRTGYALTDNFAGFTGRASAISAGLSFPLIRSQASNLYLLMEFSDRESEDYITGYPYSKSSSRTWRPSLRFDLRDDWWGGGSNFGSVTFAAGRLRSSTTAVWQGHFKKLEGQLARIQNLPGSRVLFLSLLFQLAHEDLTSAESFSLGGASKVRAYDPAEAQGRQGYVGQIELRMLPGSSYPFIFYDIGRVSAQPNHGSRNLQGMGVGLRFQQQQFFGDLSLAWRTHGGAPTSNPTLDDPRLWFKIGYRF